MRILLTNDDGINGQGLGALRRAVAGLGEVTVVAPDMERSGVGHSITLAQPLRIRKVYHGDAFFGYGIAIHVRQRVDIFRAVILQPLDCFLSGGLRVCRSCWQHDNLRLIAAGKFHECAGHRFGNRSAAHDHQ